ncbi:MAG: hypothetical protein IPP07_08735 [Holophagales bacterium]|jgi:tetratricopeptide (TPR) repeat protein|nr:hypothetical protein [Holophagales bacterium]MBK9964967.1 hypothetical protein [Holophagales bacterium]
MRDGRPGPLADLERPEALSATGPFFRAEREGRAVLARLFPATPPEAFPGEVRRHLSDPPHPALLPVELHAAGAGTCAVAPLDGTPLALLGGDPLLPVQRTVEAGLAFVAAAEALGAAGGRLGPLTPQNVVVCSSGPVPLRVFPLGAFPHGPGDLATFPPGDLLCVDRDTLRGAPGPASDAFGIGALLLRAAHGRDALPPPAATAKELLREVVGRGHPLSRVALPDGPLASLLGIALGREGIGPARSLLAALSEALQRAAEAGDAVARALALATRGDSLGALAVLHRARRDGAPSLAHLLLAARLEEGLGHLERAARTSRATLEAYPACGEAAARLARLAPGAEGKDPAPPTPAGRLTRAVTLLEADRLPEALAGLEGLRAEAVVDPSLARLGLAASLALARPLAEAGHHHGVLSLLAAPDWETDPVDDAGPAAAREEARGTAWFGLSEYDEAAGAFGAALSLEKNALGTPRPALLGELAHALVAAGRREEARRAVLAALEIDPSLVGMRRLLAALGEGNS